MKVVIYYSYGSPKLHTQSEGFCSKTEGDALCQGTTAQGPECATRFIC